MASITELEITASKTVGASIMFFLACFVGTYLGSLTYDWTQRWIKKYRYEKVIAKMIYEGTNEDVHPGISEAIVTIKITRAKPENNDKPKERAMGDPSTYN